MLRTSTVCYELPPSSPLKGLKFFFKNFFCPGSRTGAGGAPGDICTTPTHTFFFFFFDEPIKNNQNDIISFSFHFFGCFLLPTLGPNVLWIFIFPSTLFSVLPIQFKLKQLNNVFFSLTRGCARKDDADRTQRERRRRRRRRLSDDS